MGNDHDDLDFENDIADNKLILTWIQIIGILKMTLQMSKVILNQMMNLENDRDIEDDKSDTEVDSGDLDFKDDIVDNEKSDEEEKSDTDHDIKENKNELNEQCEHQ